LQAAVIFGAGEGGNFTRLAKLLQKVFFVYPGRKDTIKACFYVKIFFRRFFLRGKKGIVLSYLTAAIRIVLRSNKS
jgi:hypothetical protein